MTEFSEHPRIEEGLARRARDLGRTPLISEDRAQALRSSMAETARGEAESRQRRQWAFTLLGAAAALLLLMLVPARLDRFGRADASVAFLNPAGRVLENVRGLRSQGAPEPEAFDEFLLEVAAEEDCFLAARYGQELLWRVPVSEGLARGTLKVVAGADWIGKLPWPEVGEAVLVVVSRQPIPPELLDSHLKRSGSAGLEDAFGCRVMIRWFTAGSPND